MARSVLEIRHLQTLVALADSGSLAKAAERVFVTQSALSHQIKMLEAHYGAPLFERKTKPLRLTQIGSRLVALAREVLARIDETERDIAQRVAGAHGELRIVVECHTCYDWLMPAMDAMRAHWPQVELDLVGGFRADPLALIEQGRADFAVIHGKPPRRPGIVTVPLFTYETLAILAPDHPLARKPYLTPGDFADQVLISYPVDDAMIDVIRYFLAPRGIRPKRRNAELTVAILQLVASRRGIAALPDWSVKPYLERGYVVGKPLGARGLHCALSAAVPQSLADKPYLKDFIAKVREGVR